MRSAKLELQAIVIVIVAMLLGAIVFSLFWAQSRQRALVRTLELDMRLVYERVVPKETSPKSPVTVAPQTIADVLSKPPRGQLLPSFVTLDQIYLPLQPVRVPSDHLLCVIELDGERFFGISGNGEFRAVPPREMESWAHQ